MVMLRGHAETGRRHAKDTRGPAILTEHAFCHAVRQAQRLAHPNQRGCSVVIISMPAHGFCAGGHHRVAHVVARRARPCDAVGLFRGSAIGVLLRGTASDSAHMFCARVAADLAKLGCDPACRVICYPCIPNGNRSVPKRGTAAARMKERLLQYRPNAHGLAV